MLLASANAPAPQSSLADVVRGVTVLLATALALYSWLSPNHYPPWTSFHAQMAAMAAAVLMALLMLTKGGGPEHRWPWLGLFLGSFALVAWGQHAAGLISFSSDAWLITLYMLGIALTMFVGRLSCERLGLHVVLDRGAFLVIAGALLSMWLALHQWFWLNYLGAFAIDLPAPYTRAGSNLAQPNHFALGLTLGALGGAWLYERRHIGGPTALLLISFLGLGVVMTQSRAAYVIWVVLSLALAVWGARGALLRIRPWKAALALTLAAMTWVFWPGLLEFRGALAGAGDERTLEGMTSTGMRPLHWATMVDAISRQPWFGFGWNQVVTAQYLVAPDHPATTEMLGDSHNLVLDLLVHNGVPLGGLLTSALAYWLLRHVASVRGSGHALAVCAILVFAMASMVEFPLNHSFFLVPVAFLMGAVSTQASWDRCVILPRWFAPALLTGLTLLAALITDDYLRAEEDFRNLRFEQQRIGKPLPRTFAPHARVLTHFAAFMSLVDSPRTNRKLNDDELRAVHNVAMRNPNWSLLTYYAGVLALSDRPSDAAAVLTRICYTQKPAECQLARVRWEIWGKADEPIGRIPFPPLPKLP